MIYVTARGGENLNFYGEVDFSKSIIPESETLKEPKRHKWLSKKEKKNPTVL